MSVINSSLSTFFIGATTILPNAQGQTTIAAALDAFCYDAAALQEGPLVL